MKYLEIRNQNNEELEERLSLVMERVAQMAENPEIQGEIAEYFKVVAGYLNSQYKLFEKVLGSGTANVKVREGEENNQRFFGELLGDSYETSFANPSYACEKLGKETGTLLAAIYHQMRYYLPAVYEGDSRFLCIFAELLVELYVLFEEQDEYTLRNVKESFYSFMHDYSEYFNERKVARLISPDFDFNYEILMKSDLTDPAYLYRYGLFVSQNEIEISEYLNKFSEEEIQAMADTYTEGYRIGFETTGKDLSKKTIAEVRYPLGFERMMQVAVKNLEKLNLKVVVRPSSTSPNRQYDFDHREDAALWLDKAYVERGLEVYRNAFEKYKKEAGGYAGPAVVEVFGEEPFSPKTKQEAASYDEKQQQLSVYQTSEFTRIMYQYIKGDERSFTIIAYPLPSIGEKFHEIFAETVKINTLDYNLYQTMQQKIIDVLDTADRVHIVGTNGNKTDLYVKIYDLKNPEKETAFENCVADVNIPVGEVFTSPVLKGTEGKLHVSQVYLNDLNYKNLEIDFKDGMIADYTCTNFEKEEENRKYVQDNVLMHHETLPMGEFAIGTNTTAYRMAKVYNIADKLPILIAEKTGPHFAVGDTCYTYDEDNITYNPDGKAIVARENEVCALRKEDVSKAYFNCHTDITIPYNELGAITVIRKDGSTLDIIRDGRFVLPGTEELNVPLEGL